MAHVIRIAVDGGKTAVGVSDIDLICVWVYGQTRRLEDKRGRRICREGIDDDRRNHPFDPPSISVTLAKPLFAT